MTISSHLPDLINVYISTRTQRLHLDKQAAELKEQEEALKDTIIAKMKDANLTAAGADNGLVKLKIAREPQAQDWQQVWDYVKEYDAWDILHKRLATTAIKARWDEQMEIPGIVAVDVPKLTVSTNP